MNIGIKLHTSVFLVATCILCLYSCDQASTGEKPLFTLLPPAKTGIDFANNLDYNRKFNIFTYRNFYNGGGVAIGDINNDGLADIYFTSNLGPNKLYLNKGNFTFEDITEKAGVAGTRAWSTGVSMADVNGDGLLDIYVCNSGDVEGDNKQNELFINQGDLTFLEQAAEYGLADQGFSTHAAFFDYDNDGDLDLYLLNNSYKAIGSFNLKKNERPVRDSVGGDKLFRNDGGIFTDVSEEAGIYGSIIGFGLGVTVGDVDRDGWMDIYVSNDFFERDYLYINQGDGTFREVLEEQMRSISAASMGADMADINNDGYPDIFVTEMLPEPNERVKSVTTFENWDKYQLNLQNDYYHQFTRNMLHLNNTDGTFSEIGRLAGVHATDWSWGALIFDLDNDGYRDIFVANGIYQDLTDQDYIQFISNEEVMKTIISKDRKVDFQKLIDAMPSTPIPNYAFMNEGQDAQGRYRLTFANRAAQLGLAQPGFSNGAAYGDLDNDGDLDLVVNNVNMQAFVYRNETNVQKPGNRFVSLQLVGKGLNTFALGAKVTLKKNGQHWYQEQMPMRGFQSTVDARMHIGVGNCEVLDTLLIEWPDRKVTLRTQVATNQFLTERWEDAVEAPANPAKLETPIFEALNAREILPFVHRENTFVDFDRDRLIYHMLSNEGPGVAVGDINGDGLDDVYIGGAKDQPGVLYLQTAQGFRPTQEALFEADQVSEDTDALFFDADADGDLDLYVCSGGNEFSPSSSALFDRLYLNDGEGNFTKSAQLLPVARFINSACVRAADVDGDGDLDLFVGTRAEAFAYGRPQSSFLLLNDGKGNFTDATQQVAPGLEKIGMVTSAIWSDLNQDQRPDLLLVGEWMPVRVFMNENGQLVQKTVEARLNGMNGWWHSIAEGDFNQDGLPDFVVGNHGLNSRIKAGPGEPVNLYVADFDQNGTDEHILTTYQDGKPYPLALRHDLVMQLPILKKKYLKYEQYKDQTVEQVFGKRTLERAIKLAANTLASQVFINQGNGQFQAIPLPVEAQFSPVYALLVSDFDDDGKQDILLGGNQYRAKPEIGRYDASYGLLLKGKGDGTFAPVPARQSGIRLEGEMRALHVVKTGSGQHILAVCSNGPVQIFKTRPGSKGMVTVR